MEILIIIYILFALICAAMAKKRGRNAILGGVLGFIFGIFAIIGYAIAGETEEKKLERIKAAMGQ